MVLSDTNLLRLNMHAPQIKWSRYDDENVPADCQGYIGEYKKRCMVLALPKNGEEWSPIVVEQFRRDTRKLLRMGNSR